MTKRQTLTGKIKRSLAARGRGAFVFTDTFYFDTPEKTRVALKRLVDNGTLMRIDKGIYYYPELDKDGESLYPGGLKIVQAYTRHKGVEFRDNDQYVANRLHLSEQVPMNAVFYTNGLNKTIHYGRLKIHLIADPYTNAFKLKGDKSRLAIYALLGVGERNVTPDKIETLRPRILADDPKTLAHNYKLAPEWVQKVFYDYHLV